jgi:hypothetical protein
MFSILNDQICLPYFHMTNTQQVIFALPIIVHVIQLHPTVSGDSIKHVDVPGRSF